MERTISVSDRQPAEEYHPLQLIAEPYHFFRYWSSRVSWRPILSLYAFVAAIIVMHMGLQGYLLAQYNQFPHPQMVQAVIIQAALGLVLATTPIMYWGIWRLLRSRRELRWPAYTPDESRTALFVILCGEAVYSAGLALAMAMMYLLSDPGWSLSVGHQLVVYAGYDDSFVMQALRRVDLFMIAEVAIIAIGLRVLHGLRVRQSIYWSLGITQIGYGCWIVLQAWLLHS